MRYDDLLTVPYKAFGRDKDGMDCYGFLLELCRRDGGIPLIDFIYHDSTVNKGDLDVCLGQINVKLIDADERQVGDIVEWEYEQNLHVGYLLNKNMVIHQTFKGVRHTPILYVKNAKYGRRIKWQ